MVAGDYLDWDGRTSVVLTPKQKAIAEFEAHRERVRQLRQKQQPPKPQPPKKKFSRAERKQFYKKRVREERAAVSTNAGFEYYTEVVDGRFLIRVREKKVKSVTEKDIRGVRS